MKILARHAMGFAAALLATGCFASAASPPGPFGGKAQLEALSGAYTSPGGED